MPLIKRLQKYENIGLKRQQPKNFIRISFFNYPHPPQIQQFRRIAARVRHTLGVSIKDQLRVVQKDKIRHPHQKVTVI